MFNKSIQGLQCLFSEFSESSGLSLKVEKTETKIKQQLNKIVKTKKQEVCTPKIRRLVSF